MDQTNLLKNRPTRSSVPVLDILEAVQEQLVEEVDRFIGQADFDRYSQFVVPSVLADICHNAHVTEQRELDSIVDEMTVGYPIVEGLDIVPVGSVQDPTVRYVTLYHPQKLHYHVELVRLFPGQEIEDQPAIHERLGQGYYIVPTTMDTRNKYFGRRYRTRVDD